MKTGARRFLTCAAVLLGLAGCDANAPVTAPPDDGRAPVHEAVRPPEPPPVLVPPDVPRSQASLDLERFYAKVQADLLAQGLLRTDGGGTDTPYATHNLVENFVRIALYDEYAPRAGTMVAQQSQSRLRRWEEPVHMTLLFGATIPPAKKAADAKAVTEFAARLGRASGHPVTMTNAQNANFYVLVLNEDERRASGPLLETLIPGISPLALHTVTDMSRDTFCLVFAFSEDDNPEYSRAVAVIRGEHPDLLRLSCYHEELAQGMGLANDSPTARPSIFNDDEEFALLTTQDELMLRMLYDRRLKLGMDEATARPIVQQIAHELLPSG